MMKPKIYIDGSQGTTGLQIYERLGAREDLDLLLIDPEKRKDDNERRKFLNAADIVFLCLPDAAARQAVELIDNTHTRVIDASTAHRTADGWVYGFAELSPAHRAAIKTAARVANPGCHATGFISAVYPLVAHNVISADAALTCFSLTGYSGGGKKRIAEYEGDQKEEWMYAPAVYATHLHHKHLPEMQKVCGISQPPVFCPIIDDYYSGMSTSIMLPGVDAHKVYDVLAEHYAAEKLVRVEPFGGSQAELAANAVAKKDYLQLAVCGHEEQTVVTARFDNLGKGASGAAVQNMNIMLGLEETVGLSI